MLRFMGPSCIIGYILACCEENALAKRVAITSEASHYKRARGNGAVLGSRNFLLLSCHVGGAQPRSYRDEMLLRQYHIPQSYLQRPISLHY